MSRRPSATAHCVSLVRRLTLNEPRQHPPTRQNTLWQLTEDIFGKKDPDQNLELDENARQETEHPVK